MKEDRVTWQEFQDRKLNSLQEILERTESRIREGKPSDYNIDLDLLPILNAWNSIPFNYTFCSASGTMKEHRTHECRNGLGGEPHGFIWAHSFQNHPDFEKFNKLILRLEWFDSSSSKPDENYNLGSKYETKNKGLYRYALKIWVPQEEINKSDFYLNKNWKDLKNKLIRFRQSLYKK